MKKVFVLLVILSLILNLTSCSVFYFGLPDPQKPKIEYAEFPFELVCEIDGEEVSFKDAFVIEYKGIVMDMADGKFNVWNKSMLNSTVEFYCDYNEIFLKKGTTEDGGSYRISFYLGSYSYYMGLNETTINKFNPGNFVLRYTSEDLSDTPIEEDNYHNFFEQTIDEQTLYEKYNIKIIKKSLSEPLYDNIKN